MMKKVETHYCLELVIKLKPSDQVPSATTSTLSQTSYLLFILFAQM